MKMLLHDDPPNALYTMLRGRAFLAKVNLVLPLETYCIFRPFRPVLKPFWHIAAKNIEIAM
jgi:hypothetical protein